MWKLLRYIGVFIFVLPLMMLSEFAWWLDGWAPRAEHKVTRWVNGWGRRWRKKVVV